MKHSNRFIAFLLVFALVCTLAVPAFAAPVKPQSDLIPHNPVAQIERNRPQYPLADEKVYADSDIVRAIVFLEGAPEIEAAFGDLRAALGVREDLMAQHDSILNLMKGLDFDLAYEFTSLLNGFSLDIAYGDLEFIADLPGVASVHVANTYAAPIVDPVTPQSVIAGINTGNTAAASAGFNGAGIVVAVLDTGLNTTHEAFQDADGLCAESAVLGKDDLSKAEAAGVYLSPKVPFAYDYADKDTDVTDYIGHGTHVSGISTGYAVDEEDGAIVFRGAAPAAQLLAMKVFSDTDPGTSSDIYFQALEDAYRLGADVINMSLGAPNGFTYDDSLESEGFGNIYKRLDEAGIILSISAGNEGSMADTAAQGYIGPDYTDYGTVATPSTYEGNLSVASQENAAFPQVTMAIGDSAYTYVDSSINETDPVGLWLQVFGDREVPFTVVKAADGSIALGNEADFAGLDLKGKIAVVQRGEISFQDKLLNAAKAGAAGLIVCNNEEGLFGMSIQNYAIPAIAVDVELQEVFLNAKTASLSFPSLASEQESPVAFEMSSFSGWGTSPSLTIDPCLTSFGGMINSAYIDSDTSYTLMSGTSMSAPFLTGTLANTLAFLEQSGFKGDKVQRAAAAEALLQSSASIIPDGDSLYAVRRQGAGLANIMNAIDNYNNAGYIVDPLKELGDDPKMTGVYTFEFTLRNTTDRTVRYSNFNAEVLSDALANINTEEDPVLANQLHSLLLGADLTVKNGGKAVKSLDLAAGASAKLEVTIKLDADSKNYLSNFPNGTFVEGFVSFTTDEKFVNHATFLAYYGDWTAAPATDPADFGDLLDAAYFLATTEGDEEGHTLEELGIAPEDVMNCYTVPSLAFQFQMDSSNAIFFPGGNLFADVPFMAERAAFSTAKSSSAFCDSLAIQPSLLRNVLTLTVRITDAKTGATYFEEATPYIPKDRYDARSESWQPMVYFAWDGTDANEKMLPSGTVVNVEVDAVLPYEETDVDTQWSFPVTVDYTVPELQKVQLDAAKGTLTVTATDEQFLQSISLQHPESTLDDPMIFDLVPYAGEKTGETCTATFDIKPLLANGIDRVNVVALDYATNYAAKTVDLYTKGENAAIKLVDPNGKAQDSALTTGKTFTFPECETELKGAAFDCWTTAPVTDLSKEDYDSIPKFYAGDEMVVTGNATYYALYAVGYEIELTTPKYGLLSNKPETGEYTIVGLGVNADGSALDPNRPFALDEQLGAINVAALPDAEIDQQYLAFSTECPVIRYVLEAAEGGRRGQMTIRNAATGQYLAIDGQGNGTMADEITEQSTWTVKPHPAAKYAVVVTNAANSKIILVFNYLTNQFQILDKNEVVGQNGNGQDVSAGDAFNVLMYSLIESDFSTDYYTTDAGNVVHNHKWDAGVVTKQPTCTEDGIMTYTCQGCGETKTEVIPGGHDWDEGTVTAEPSCSSDGQIVYTCRRCGEKRTETIPALPHSWDNGVITKEPTCTETGVKTYTCEDCGEQHTVEIPSFGGHHYDSGTVTKQPTATETGIRVRTCPVCGDQITEIIPALEASAGKCYFSEFVDCKAEWYHEAVDYMVSRQLMAGVGEKRFAPSTGMTRGMMVTVLYSAAGSPAVKEPSTFVDVPKNEWFANPVAWAQDNDIVAGMTPNKFGPNVQITREQIAMILWRYSGSPEAVKDLSKFADEQNISDYAVAAMKWAVAEGILAGDNNGRLNPTKCATRAEFAVMMLRYLDGSYQCNKR